MTCLAQYAKNIPQARELGVLGESGDWMFSSFETVPAVNNGDREYFRYHQSHPEDAAPRISEPLISRVTGRPTLLMTQRLPNPDGSFGGVVFAAIDLAYFRSFYQGFEAEQDRTVTLMTTSGKVLVHRRDDQVGKDLARNSFLAHLKDSEAGLYSIVSPFDGRTKQFPTRPRRIFQSSSRSQSRKTPSFRAGAGIGTSTCYSVALCQRS